MKCSVLLAMVGMAYGEHVSTWVGQWQGTETNVDNGKDKMVSMVIAADGSGTYDEDKDMTVTRLEDTMWYGLRDGWRMHCSMLKDDKAFCNFLVEGILVSTEYTFEAKKVNATGTKPTAVSCVGQWQGIETNLNNGKDKMASMVIATDGSGTYDKDKDMTVTRLEDSMWYGLRDGWRMHCSVLKDDKAFCNFIVEGILTSTEYTFEATKAKVTETDTKLIAV
eukprot:TRINITY_DN5918_c0_g1_i1.p1 TRINITY_DN5918_c0_g1~~TRINITY_DN5918_c0_g1_i1.p1  ORF type:complete len:222 (-),score=41.83 TRINITY_DN5918_c0_g1_i1:116-781(-)